jgi:D-glycero-D-manno-heptose 1,7-bisphosphate phosphatase
MIFTQYSSRAENLVPAVFLDRDGTVNVEKNYLYKIADWQWVDGAEHAIKRLKDAGYLVVVVSNQAGIARGMYSAEDVNSLHEFVNAELAKIGAKIDAFYFCPHHPEITGACDCRKPSPNMLLQAVRDLGIDLTRSWMVGDKEIDAEAGIAANVSPVMVRTGYGSDEEKRLSLPVTIVDDIAEAVQFILEKNYK